MIDVLIVRLQSLPIPPLQKLGIVNPIACIVCGTAEHVQDASVNVEPSQIAEVAVHLLGILTGEIPDFPEAEIVKVSGNPWTNPGDGLEFIETRLFYSYH
jgi:hypothetical protein